MTATTLLSLVRDGEGIHLRVAVDAEGAASVVIDGPAGVTVIPLRHATTADVVAVIDDVRRRHNAPVWREEEE